MTQSQLDSFSYEIGDITEDYVIESPITEDYDIIPFDTTHEIKQENPTDQKIKSKKKKTQLQKK